MRAGAIEEEFSQIFFGHSIAWIQAEERYPIIHSRKSDIPQSLWPLGRFPKYQWFRDELVESGEAYIHGKMIHPLYHASELDRIKAEYPLRLKDPKPCYTATDLKKKGFTKKEISAMTPYAEQMNRMSGYWYYLYLKSDIDALQAANDQPSSLEGIQAVPV